MYVYIIENVCVQLFCFRCEHNSNYNVCKCLAFAQSSFGVKYLICLQLNFNMHDFHIDLLLLGQTVVINISEC